MSNVELVIDPKAKDLGDNFQVRRALPSIKKRMIGPFIFWDHMGPVTLLNDKKMTVRAHPHIGLSTITYLFTGEIMHRDSLGNEQPIRPGEVNWMTAGKGIVHSERSEAPIKGEALELEGIQLWVALPKNSEDVEPSFVHFKEESLPHIEENGIQLRLIAGKGLGAESPVPVYSDLFYFNGRASKGKRFEMKLSSDQEGALYVVKGKIKVEGDIHTRFSLISFKKGTTVAFQADENSEFMLFGGSVFPEKRHIWWNFVSSSKDKIEQAKDDWKNDKFPKVINEDEVIPLPE
ncbi:pirin family protein [Pseudobacteriovorax antillogorgiicola]|uniref:Pirin n=1 Tax=Pseudobacteriovorax antillogorgiicola TaxID=1513793 RepID=A0A1Y6BLZ9_9BACT|nr:pirin family protein [Pseudobacteriovorax antillogorgiicola]TCS54533.1 hypothetical protein EDD56_10646 [Pseudobacteriovorax antillogorgiicola]SMF18710.1 hypothetical protein SAMN06296036_106197 [Pseudobacteriovorax antillogorgiicola]